MTTQHEVAVSSLKLGSAWAAVGITSWSDVAAFLAACYSALLIGEFFWKHCGRPYAESKGWIARRARRKEDVR